VDKIARLDSSRFLVFSALLFAFLYAVIEYYFIRDPSFGLRPVLFSLVYPYHIIMAGIFLITAYLISSRKRRLSRLPKAILVIGLFSLMIVAEDFSWFLVRAIVPYDGAYSGKLIMNGEWTTQFMGSTDAYFTAIPNWYFVCLLFAAAAITSLRVSIPNQKAVPAGYTRRF